MSGLKTFKKIDLQALAAELDVEIEENDTIAKIIKKIESADDFDSELALAQAKNIMQERETRIAEEKENQKLAREDREKERAFELEKLKLSQETETRSNASSLSAERSNKLPLKSLIHRFDEDKSEISLFLNLFERQAKKCNLEDDELVTNLLALLPANVAESILREPPDKIESYDYVKSKLLERYKLNTEAYRLKFNQHQRNPNNPWRDLIFELSSYLEGWLNSLSITSFEELKNLLITDQIRKRVPQELREHLIDIWSNFKDPEVLVKRLDELEAVKRSQKKSINPRSTFEKKYERNSSWVEDKSAGKPFNWRDRDNNGYNKERDKVFEKRRANTCFVCSSNSHYKVNCPELKKREKESARVNHISDRSEFEEAFTPYLSQAKVNGREIVTLRDSGSCADLLSADHVSPEQLTGDYLFVKQPLDSQVHCLPIAEVELEIKGLGVLKTKAGVVDKESGLQYYLLGNKTQNMIDSAKQQVSLVNAVVTRSKSRNERDNTLQTVGGNNECESESARGSDVIESEDEISERLGRDDDELQNCRKNEDIDSMFLPAESNDKFGKLARISREDFKREQENDILLREVWEKARAKKSHFMTINNLLYRKTLDNRGGDRLQLVIPSSFRLDILGACHEGISAHLGEKKTKDKVLRHYFWPNCIKEIEHFVKTCECCQKIGKPKERGKAPLSRVPIIGEIFSKLSVDTVGPLPRSEKGNKYLLTVICAASRYPEAIPIPDIKSETIVEALMWVFSRLGYPKEIQTDLGKSFVSNLTTTFLEKFGIKVTHSSVCHPASNLIERWHRSVKRLLKVLCLENGASWEGNLPYALLALRTVTHDSTGFSPAELIHGKNLRTPETLLFEKWTGEEEENELITEYVFKLMNRLRHCQELAIENMTEAREKRKFWYDKKAVERNFKVGEEVLVLATSKKNKMSVNWIGPGKIESKISDTNYIVNVPGRREKA